MPEDAKIPPHRPFGSVVTAMVTPFTNDGELDKPATAAVARHLVSTGSDGLVLGGTTGEAPTTTLDEKLKVVEIVRREVGDDIPLVCGVGSYNTAEDVAVVQRLSEVADGLLVLPPYYSKPTQAGITKHFLTLADAATKPIMIYDIPGRVGVPVATDTLIALAEHERIVAVKDAKADLHAANTVLAATDLAWYCGDDHLALPYLALGAAGFVTMAGHVASRQLADMVALYDAGRVAQAAGVHRRLIGVYDVIGTLVPGACAAKAALQHLGVLTNRAVRCPMMEAPEDVCEEIARALKSLA